MPTESPQNPLPDQVPDDRRTGDEPNPSGQVPECTGGPSWRRPRNVSQRGRANSRFAQRIRGNYPSELVTVLSGSAVLNH